MINPLNTHYSFTNPATVHDEEALTTLELVGRTAAKMNEVVHAQNELRTQTENHLGEQDNTIDDRMDAQDKAIPLEVRKEVEKQITDGTFDSQMNHYLNGLNEKVDNLLSNVPSGSTTMDAEIVDARRGANGKPYEYLGEAIRSQFNDPINPRKMVGYTITSPNLFDKNTITKGLYLYASGNFGEFEDYFTSDYIPVEPNTEYVTSCEQLSFYDENFNWLSSVQSVGVLTTPENCKYVRFSKNLNALNYTSFNRGSELSSPDFSYTFDGLEVDVPANGKNFEENSVPISKITECEVVSSNLFNPDNVEEGVYLNHITGDTREIDGYFTSYYIGVKPNTTYSSSYMEQLVIYDNEMNRVWGSNEVHTFTTPANGYFIRFSNAERLRVTSHFNEGETLKEMDTYRFRLKGLETGESRRIYTLSEAWGKWANNEKFPIGFLGDSTTDGANTTGWSSENSHEQQDAQAGGTGKVDYINQNAYPYKLQELIRKELNNNTMRVYNMGYSGRSFYSMIPLYDDLFSGVYADVKMVGITLGINDRIAPATEKQYYEEFKTNLIYTVDYLFKKGIQPFIVTSQAITESSPADDLGTVYPLRSSLYINKVANCVKKEVATMYGLEIIDMTSFGEFMMTYSSNAISEIIPDSLHFGDLGHTLESQFLFYELCGRGIEVGDGSSLTFTTQNLLSKVPSNWVYRSTTLPANMKMYVNKNNPTSTDTLLQDFWVFNVEKFPLTLKAYTLDALTQYVKVDDVVYNITDEEQVVTTLDCGVHHIQAYSGTGNVNWIGFKLEKEV